MKEKVGISYKQDKFSFYVANNQINQEKHQNSSMQISREL